MKLFLLLLFGGLFLALTVFRKRPCENKHASARSRALAEQYQDPHLRETFSQNHTARLPALKSAIYLGNGLAWLPRSHPNPHLLVVGGSGSGKSHVLRHLAKNLLKDRFRCILFDFHGDLAVEGISTTPITMNSDYGVNPLVLSFDPAGGGPDPQRFEVLEQLKNTFRPMGSLQLALLDDCLKAVYAKYGIFQNQPESWSAKPFPDFRDVQAELRGRTKTSPNDLRLKGLQTKLTPAFDFQIFGKPQVPLPQPQSGGNSVRLDFSRLPHSLQFLAADTLLRHIFRGAQLSGHHKTDLYLIVDESKLCTPAQKDTPSAALNRIATEGRKFGLGLIVSSQYAGHLGRDIVSNTFAKVLMRTDLTEVAATARRFQVEETLVTSLRHPGDALIRFADSTVWQKVRFGS